MVTATMGLRGTRLLDGPPKMVGAIIPASARGKALRFWKKGFSDSMMEEKKTTVCFSAGFSGGGTRHRDIVIWPRK
jgi:hypothetical protein